MRWYHLLAAAALAVFAATVIGWLAIAPGWAVARAQEQANAVLGRTLEVRGGAHLEFSPLAIRLDDVSLAGPEGQEERFLTAKAVRIPVSLGQLVGRELPVTSLKLEGAELAFLIDERGQANWSFPSAAAPQPVKLEFAGGSLRYFDARNGQAMMIGGITALADADTQGAMTLNGTAEIRGRLAKFEATLKALARVHADGSPLNLAIETPEGSVSFDGRLSTAKVLSLTGFASLKTPDLRSAARWMGIAVGEGATFRDMALDGAIDSAGRALSFRDSTLTLDGGFAAGEVALDFRGDRPKLQAALALPTLDLSRLMPEGGKSGEWSNAPFAFAALRGFDAEVTLDTKSLTLGTFQKFPARVVATLTGGKLEASAALKPSENAALSFVLSVDANAAPPAIGLDIKTENADAAPLLASLTGKPWLTGTGNVAASMSGTGQTQQEVVGTLKGTVEASLSNGAIAGLDAQGLLAAVSQQVVDGWNGGPQAQTPYASLTVSLSIADGIASVNGFSLAGPAFAVTASGEVDLLRRALDLKTNPSVVSQGTATASFPVGIIVKGPWDGPRIYPDVPGILSNPAEGFATLKSMGLPPAN